MKAITVKFLQDEREYCQKRRPEISAGIPARLFRVT